MQTKLATSRGLAAVTSPHLTVEEAFLLATFIRGLDPDATLALGHVPVEGADERFKSGFTILRREMSNRRGVEAVLQTFPVAC